MSRLRVDGSEQSGSSATAQFDDGSGDGGLECKEPASKGNQVHMKTLTAALLLIPAIAVAQPKSVHYSDLGKYLVDENGHQTRIQGHPWITCVEKDGTYSGIFQKEVDGVIYMKALTANGAYIYHVVKWPACDLK